MSDRRLGAAPAPRAAHAYDDCDARLAVPADPEARCVCGVPAFEALDGMARVLAPAPAGRGWLGEYLAPGEVDPIACWCGLAYDVTWRVL